MKKVKLLFVGLIIFFIILSLLAITYTTLMPGNINEIHPQPIYSLKDTTDADYLQIDPYSIAGDTELNHLNDSDLIKLVQNVGNEGMEAELLVDVFFPAINLPSTMESLLFIFRILPWETATSSFEQLRLTIDLYQFDGFWHYVKVFNATTSDLDFKFQDVSSEVNLSGLDKVKIDNAGYMKFRFNFTATYTSSQSSINLYLLFNYLKLIGGNNIEFIKMYPTSTSFTGQASETVRIDDSIQSLLPDGTGRYEFYGTQLAVMGFEDDETVCFHLEPLAGHQSIIFNVTLDLEAYRFDDVHAAILYHHEFLELGYTGSFSGFELEYYNASHWNDLTPGGKADDDEPTMYPTEDLQGILIPLNPAMLAFGELVIRYRANFQVDVPDPEDFIAIAVDTCYLMVVRPLRPVVEFTPACNTTQILENYTVDMTYYTINGCYPHPITKLEVFKEGEYEELPIGEEISKLEFYFTEDGTQSYHFKVTFGADYYCTENFEVEVFLRDYICALSLNDVPNTLQLSLTVTDFLNGSTRPNILVDITIYHYESLGWNSIYSRGHLTNENGTIYIELDLTGRYYLHQYYASISMDLSSYYNSFLMPSPVVTCTNCTPEITVTNHADPPDFNVLELASVDFYVETLQLLNRSWITYDGKILCEIVTIPGANYVEFHGVKGTHVYQVRLENILGEVANSNPFVMNLNEAKAKLYSASNIITNSLQISFYVENEVGAKITVPVKIEVWDQGILLLSMILESSQTSISSYQLNFDVFSSHVFEVYMIVDDIRYESNSISLTNAYRAIPIGSIILEVCGSCSLIGIGTVYFVKKKRES